jgi:phage portal protein BeeE
LKSSSNGSPIATDHPLAEIIGSSGSPNIDQTSLEYWESVVAWLLVSGNACSEISLTGRRVSALNVLPNAYPWRDNDGVLVYKFSDRGKDRNAAARKSFPRQGLWLRRR